MAFLFTLLLHPINDITTNFSEPPQFLGKEALAKPNSFPPEFVSLQKQMHPDVHPLLTTKTIQEIFDRAQSLAASHSNWRITLSDAKSGRIEAVATTSMLRFKDDIVIEIRDTGNERRVEMRSRSRVGKSDLGANADRIQKFISDLEHALQ